MNTLIIYGAEEKKEISDILKKYFCRHGGCTYVSADQVYMSGDAANLIVESGRLSQIDAQKGIIIFKNDITDFTFPSIPPGFTAVLSCENTAALNFLRENKIVAATCGLSATDTFSLSSLEEDTATVSLQRELRTLGGEINEPQDVVIKNTMGLSGFTAMCLCAAVLITGKSEGLSIDL